MRGTIRLRSLWLLALALVSAAAAMPAPAQAQFWGFGYQPPARRAPPSRGFFSFPFFERGYRSPYGPYGGGPAPADSSRAPPPHKVETQPTRTVVVIGDSMADWLAYGLEEVYADQPDIGVVRKIRTSSGLIHYEPRNDTLEWSQAVKDILAADKPSAIVVMLGLNDRVALRNPAPPREPAPHKGEPPAQTGNAAKETQQQKPAPQQAPEPAAPDPAAANNGEAPEAAAESLRPGMYEFRSEQWALLYRKRIDDMIAALKAKGVPVLWVGLPALRGPRSTADMGYLDDLYHAAADKAGIRYVDIWDGFVDENGRYSVQGPDFEGQTRRLRTGDGVHFTKFGALKLAHLVDQDLGRLLTNNPAVAAPGPGPEAAAPAKPGAARPAIGPVLPLAATGNGQTGDLLGAKAAAPATGNPLATSVLVRGDAPPAPPGRADNFSWPPRGGAANPPAAAPAH